MDETKLLYAESHEWIHVEDAVCVIGITRYAVEQLTDIVYVELPEVGKSLAVGVPFGVIESVKAVSDLYAPVVGEVVAVNDKVADDPALLSEDPYEAGWMIKVRLAGTFDTSGLMDKDAYDRMCASESH